MILAEILWRRVQERGRWPLGNCGIRHWWCQKLCCFTDFTRNTITFQCEPWKTDCIDVDPNWIKPNLILEHRMNKIYCYWSKYMHCIYWEWIPYIHYFTLVFKGSRSWIWAHIKIYKVYLIHLIDSSKAVVSYIWYITTGYFALVSRAPSFQDKGIRL